MKQFTYLRGVIARLEIARTNLKKAQANGTYQEHDAACKAWTAAYTDYVNW